MREDSTLLEAVEDGANVHFLKTGKLNYRTGIDRQSFLVLLRDLRDDRSFYTVVKDGSTTGEPAEIKFGRISVFATP